MSVEWTQTLRVVFFQYGFGRDEYILDLNNEKDLSLIYAHPS